MNRGAWWVTVHGVSPKELDTTEQLTHKRLCGKTFIVVCTDIKNRRETGHREDQRISGIINRLKSLITNPVIRKVTTPHS